MSRKSFAIGIFIIIIAAAIVLNVYQRRVKFVDIKIGSNYYHLEIADTAAKRAEGLSGRDSLAQNEGMIFLLPYPGRYTFTMEGMKFPLDFIWLQDNQIVDLTPDAQPWPSTGSDNNLFPERSEAESEGLTKYSSRQLANRVIELNAGAIQKESLKIGDVIQ